MENMVVPLLSKHLRETQKTGAYVTDVNIQQVRFVTSENMVILVLSKYLREAKDRCLRNRCKYTASLLYDI